MATAKGLLISERELEALQGQPYMLTVLYLYLRQFMDYSTGVVGRKRGISYQSIGEALYLEPEPGIKSGSPHRSAIRRALDRLERIGAIRRIGGNDNLIFSMPFAQRDKSFSNQADTKPTPHPDTPQPLPPKASKVQADRGINGQADTPPVSGNTSIPVTTTTTPTGGDCSSQPLIFPRRTHEADKVAMVKTLQGFEPEQQQELLDELSGYIERGKVQSTPIALLHGMAQRSRTGAFVPNYAPKVKAAREKTIQEAAAPAKVSLTPEGKAKSRAMLKNAMKVLNGGKAAVVALGSVP